MGADTVTSYEIQPDLELWIPVPRSFPEADWDTAEQWAEDLSEVAIPRDPELRKTYRELALEVAANQAADADHTLWYSPEDGHAMGTAHLVIEDDDDEASLEELAAPDHDSMSPAQTEEFDSTVFGRIIQSTSVISLDLPRADETVLLPAIGHVRTVGRCKGLVFILEAFDSDLSNLALMMDPMVQLLDTVTIDDSE